MRNSLDACHSRQPSTYLSWDIMRMPANVSKANLANVTTGLANDIDEVNQYVAVVYAATANSVPVARVGEQLMAIAIRSNVAMNLLHHSCCSTRLWQHRQSTRCSGALHHERLPGTAYPGRV